MARFDARAQTALLALPALYFVIWPVCTRQNDPRSEIEAFHRAGARREGRAVSSEFMNYE